VCIDRGEGDKSLSEKAGRRTSRPGRYQRALWANPGISQTFIGDPPLRTGAMMAIAMGGGPSMAFMRYVLDACNEFGAE
jgi:hypothetical protein